MTSGNGIVFTIAALALGSAVLRASPLHISGEQNGLYERNVYIVDSTVTIPAGTELTFAAGTKVYFVRYSGLQVSGSLKCIGTSDNPIVFTSINDTGDTTTTPVPFSWNGISVDDSGRADLKHCAIKYSTAGLAFQHSSSIHLDSVLFFRNGRGDVTLNNEPVLIDTKPVVFYEYPGPFDTDVPATKTPTQPVPSSSKSTHRRVLLPTAISCGIGAIACIVGSRISYARAQQAIQEENNASSYSSARKAATEKDNAVHARAVFDIAGATTGAFSIGAAITFFIAETRAK